MPSAMAIAAGVASTPSLFSGNFYDCLGGQSLFNVTSFDAAYYSDPPSAGVHIRGSSNIKKESLMLVFSISAYGGTRFQANLDPCEANVPSLCPLQASTSFEAWIAINMTQAQAQGIPSSVLGIPDVESAATIQLFANSTQTEIGCFQAALSNGNTFSHPRALAPILAVCATLATGASFATAIYGYSISHVHRHYAHALSALTVIEAFQSIYFSGALSVSWPAILPAWWSNFAWSAGAIPVQSLLASIDAFVGVSGNASQVGDAGSDVLIPGGGLAHQLYGRAVSITDPVPLQRLSTYSAVSPVVGFSYSASAPWNASWAGSPAIPGLPLPGQYSGFAGTLAASGIPAKDVFLLCLTWISVAVAVAVFLVAISKFALDLLVRLHWLKSEGFTHFRSHLPAYLAVSALRALVVVSFAVFITAIYQLSLQGATGPTVLAAIVLVILLLTLGGLAIYGGWLRLRHGHVRIVPDTIRLLQTRVLFGIVPFIYPALSSSVGDRESSSTPLFQLSWFRIVFDEEVDGKGPHDDEAYLQKFGWLTGRYRRNRWWFFVLWLAYNFVRACLIGGGAGNPQVQVSVLFAFDIVAFVSFVLLKPLEGQRNTVLAIWMIFVCRIATTALSIPFLPSIRVQSVAAAAIGIVIIIIQSFLVAAVLVLTLLGCVSTWMSLFRNRERFPLKLDQVRIRYYDHVELPTRFSAPLDAEGQRPPKEPRFAVNHVRRSPKIEDEAPSSHSGNQTNTKSLPRSAIRKSAATTLVARADGIPSIASIVLGDASSLSIFAVPPLGAMGSAISLAGRPNNGGNMNDGGGSSRGTKASASHRQSWSSHDSLRRNSVAPPAAVGAYSRPASPIGRPRRSSRPRDETLDGRPHGPSPVVRRSWTSAELISSRATMPQNDRQHDTIVEEEPEASSVEQPEASRVSQPEASRADRPEASTDVQPNATRQQFGETALVLIASAQEIERDIDIDTT